MKVAIITEGLESTGYGHLTRCLSIYQAFEDRYIVPLYIANCDENGKKFVENINLLQLDWLCNLNKFYEIINGYDIAIIDSYLAPVEIYEEIQKSVKKVVFIDDYIRLDYPPGIILNGTIGAENLPYKKGDQHKYLLGIDYMPLRQEFWDVKISKSENTKVNSILITFGGQDNKKLTFPILNFLMEKYPNIIYHVVQGISEETRISARSRNHNVRFYSFLNTKEMLNLMLKSDLAITASGQTTYELARIGVRTIAVVVADNQKYNLKGWMDAGFLKHSIVFNNSYEEVINLLNESLRYHLNGEVEAKLNSNYSFCDGQGARRIVNETVNEYTLFN